MNQKIDQQRYRAPGAAFLCAAYPRRSRHIKVGPFKVLGELAEERGGGTGAAFAPADIGDVGKVALELIAIVIADGQTPSAVGGAYAGRLQLLGQGGRVAHQTADVIPERNDAGA